jgi:alpha-galactosidase
MEGMPRGAIVETNAVFTGGEVRPVLAGRLPPAVEALVLPHAARQAPLLDAVLDRDRHRLFGLFLDDPLVTCGQADAKRLFDIMAAKNGMDGNGWK